MASHRIELRTLTGGNASGAFFFVLGPVLCLLLILLVGLCILDPWLSILVVPACVLLLGGGWLLLRWLLSLRASSSIVLSPESLTWRGTRIGWEDVESTSVEDLGYAPQLVLRTTHQVYKTAALKESPERLHRWVAEINGLADAHRRGESLAGPENEALDVLLGQSG